MATLLLEELMPAIVDDLCPGFGPEAVIAEAEQVVGAAVREALARGGCRPAPVCTAMLTELTAAHPGRSRASDGICGDAAHAARTSDHNPDGTGYAHAADATHDPAHGMDTYWLADQLRLRCAAGLEPRVKYIISNYRIASPLDGWRWRRYTGANGHTHHMHVSFTSAATYSTAPLFAFLDEGGHPEPPRWGHLAAPAVGGTARYPYTSGGLMAGYWLCAADGGVFNFGGAPFLGSAVGPRPLNRPVVGMAACPDGNGYLLAAADGGLFAFGSAPWYGNLVGLPLAKPVVAIAITPTGRGYLMAGGDGGLFAFGDAPQLGSLAQVPLAKPIVGMALTATGLGAWLVGEDGGVFALGDATYYGGLAPAPEPIVAIAPSPSGRGYYLLGRTGHLYPFGDATPWGQLGKLEHAATHLLVADAGVLVEAEDGGLFGLGKPPFPTPGSVPGLYDKAVTAAAASRGGPPPPPRPQPRPSPSRTER